MSTVPHLPSRRQFLSSSAVALASTGLLGSRLWANEAAPSTDDNSPPFSISLAEWSLHRTLGNPSKNVTNLDFPAIAKKLGIDAIEYVNSFFKDKARDSQYLTDLKSRCDDQGVKSLLIMVDGEGALGAPKEADREKSVTNHYRWIDAAKFLGCHSIRVNAQSSGSYEEQQKLAADGLRRLSEHAAPQDINVIVENHGGLSSNGKWLSETIEMVGLDNCGTLPDFGNFFISRNPVEWFDNYEGVDLLMPYAKAVSAKTHQFMEGSNISYQERGGKKYETDYDRMMEIVVKHGYHGYVGIEYEGPGDEYEGIRKTKAVLDRVAASIAETATVAG
ncbi:sugar phosphate isomerase/epimerase family protein [Novipirellula aureliae]|nr:sugar phosphate isomerase/epimerase family protein [Novipirellula aureliae]